MPGEPTGPRGPDELAGRVPDELAGRVPLADRVPDELTGPRGPDALAGRGPDDSVLRGELARLGRGTGVTAVQRLAGGFASDAWLVRYGDGTRAVGKTFAGAPPDLFPIEAEGLAALRSTGHVQTPQVLAVTSRLLLLEALPPRADTEACWAAFAADLAALHRNTVHDRFGWEHDGYLGRIPQLNAWTASGHEFFARYRLLRFLGEPLVEQALTSADRRALEHLCDRLPEVIPVMPPVLTHGDLWSANLLGRADGGLAVIDPAVSYTWAEVDLSMLWSCPRPPASGRFFDVYQDLNPSPPGWAGRMPVLNLRELLSVVAYTADSAAAVSRIREILAPFSRR
jgi:fructosamine-3-kinase